MKRESNTRHYFSFGEYFDENVMRGYYIDTQTKRYLIHQIIVFSFTTKSVGIYIMNIQEAKAIPLADYLQSLGIHPSSDKGVTSGTNPR